MNNAELMQLLDAAQIAINADWRVTTVTEQFNKLRELFTGMQLVPEPSAQSKTYEEGLLRAAEICDDKAKHAVTEIGKIVAEGLAYEIHAEVKP